MMIIQTLFIIEPIISGIILSAVMLPNTQRRQPRINKQILFIVCIYIILTISNRLSTNNNESDDALIKKMQNSTSIQTEDIFNKLQKQKFQGEWTQRILDSNISKGLLPKQKGKFQMFLRPVENKFVIDLKIKNSEYIDDGQLTFHILELQRDKLNLTFTDNKITAQFSLKQESKKVSFIEQVIFQTKRRGQFNLTNIHIIYQVEGKKLLKKLIINTQNQQIVLTLKKQQYNMSATILFALILFLVAYSQFSACLQILKKFIQNEEDPSNYSFITLAMAMMWDAALCLTSFIQAFQNQQNIILFIVPAFILCILFTNLQLRIMIMVFQAVSGESDIRNVICKFNILSYGAIIGMYPLLVFTNMGTSLFLGFSLIFLPQIYANAIAGKRPNPNSIYYNEFLFFRFLIVLYLKCFPYNTFNLKPDYLLGFGCLLIVACQFGLLWIQKIYGPKKVLPKFLQPQVFMYSYDLKNDDHSLSQCTICLQALTKDPQIQPPDLQVVSRVMKTPCNHIYHGICLAQWMKLKMQCPQCRSKLPAYQ